MGLAQSKRLRLVRSLPVVLSSLFPPSPCPESTCWAVVFHPGKSSLPTSVRMVGVCGPCDEAANTSAPPVSVTGSQMSRSSK